MKDIYTLKGFAGSKGLARMEIINTNTDKAAIRAARQILAENQDVDRVEIRKGRNNEAIVIRRKIA